MSGGQIKAWRAKGMASGDERAQAVKAYNGGGNSALPIMRRWAREAEDAWVLWKMSSMVKDEDERAGLLLRAAQLGEGGAQADLAEHFNKAKNREEALRWGAEADKQG